MIEYYTGTYLKINFVYSPRLSLLFGIIISTIRCRSYIRFIKSLTISLSKLTFRRYPYKTCCVCFLYKIHEYPNEINSIEISSKISLQSFNFFYFFFDLINQWVHQRSNGHKQETYSIRTSSLYKIWCLFKLYLIQGI